VAPPTLGAVGGAFKEYVAMETFRGHKFWVGAAVGAIFVYWVLPRILSYSRGGGS